MGLPLEPSGGGVDNDINIQALQYHTSQKYPSMKEHLQEDEITNRMSSLRVEVSEVEETSHLYDCPAGPSISSPRIISTLETIPASDNPASSDIEEYPSVYKTFEDKFYYFNSFPLRIRIRIWEALLPGKRVIQLSKQTYSPLPIPHAHVCRESRQVALRHYRSMFPAPWIEPEHSRKIYIAPDRDTLVIDIRSMSLSRYFAMLANGVVANLCSIALCGWEVMFEDSSRASWSELECLREMPCLVSLNLVFAGRRDGGDDHLEIKKAFTRPISSWPDELESGEVEQLVREEVAVCCTHLSYGGLRHLKRRLNQIREVLRTWKAMNSTWKEPKLRIRILFGLEDASPAVKNSIEW